MTHPTKAIYHQLLKDYVKVAKGSADEALYGEEDLEASMKMIQVIDFHQTFDVDGIKVGATASVARLAWLPGVAFAALAGAWRGGTACCGVQQFSAAHVWDEALDSWPRGVQPVWGAPPCVASLVAALPCQVGCAARMLATANASQHAPW
jgi:hypothetical protein